MGLYNPMNGEVISCLSYGVSGSPLGMNPGGTGSSPVMTTRLTAYRKNLNEKLA